MQIVGYFRTIKNANEAVNTLKRTGFRDSVADLNEHYTGSDNSGSNVPGTDSSTNSLSSLVLNSGDPLGDPRLGPLAAASPMVSGMGGFEEIADINYKVIVNTDEKNGEKVKQIISRMGGDLKDPNFRMPEGMENISIDDLISNMINDVDERRY